jgi:hypothetical protein
MGAFDKALQLDPEHSNALFNKGVVFHVTDKYQMLWSVKIKYSKIISNLKILFKPKEITNSTLKNKHFFHFL